MRCYVKEDKLHNLKAGKKANFTLSDDCSIAGMIRLQIDAATITLAAKPVKARLIPIFRSFFKKKTHAAPADVPRKGINNPNNKLRVIRIRSYNLIVKASP